MTTHLPFKQFSSVVIASYAAVTPKIIAAAFPEFSMSEDFVQRLIDAARDSTNHELLIYHCDRTKPGGAIVFGIGFPQLPWTCPTCGKTVTEMEDLNFNVGKRNQNDE